MREWLLLGVLALGGLLGLWLLLFKSLAARYEFWQSGREFDRLTREARSRRSQRPSDLIREKEPKLPEADDSDMPVIPPSLLDSLSDDQADPRLVPGKTAPAPPPEPAEGPDDDLLMPPRELPGTDPFTTTSSSPPPTFPLPPMAGATPREPQAPPAPADEPSSMPPSDDPPQQPPRHE